MKAALTAVIAAIEAAAVALAVFAIIGIPTGLLWWLSFDMAAEPSDITALLAAFWQLVHFAPLEFTISAQLALSLGLPAEVFGFVISLAPLGLTALSVWLAYRAGWRAGKRGKAGVPALVGGFVGFAAAAAVTGTAAGEYGVLPMWARIALPAAVYFLPMVIAFVIRAALEGAEWWFVAVRAVQKAIASFAPSAAAALPERAAEVTRLVSAASLSLLGLGAFGLVLALLFGYIEIVTLSQAMHLDVAGAFLLFLLQLVMLPIAWIWSISWFIGPGFAIGTSTSVTPFETLLGPLPALPLLGAVPDGWGWAGGLAPVLVVAVGAALGGLAGGRPNLRRGPVSVAITVPLIAAIFTGLIVTLLCVAASGAVGPGRLSEVGPQPWLVGGFAALELAFGMTLGVFARRFDVSRAWATVESKMTPGSAAPEQVASASSARDRVPGGSETANGLKRDSAVQRDLASNRDPALKKAAETRKFLESWTLTETRTFGAGVGAGTADSNRAVEAKHEPATPPKQDSSNDDPLLRAFEWSSGGQGAGAHSAAGAAAERANISGRNSEEAGTEVDRGKRGANGWLRRFGSYRGSGLDRDEQ